MDHKTTHTTTRRRRCGALLALGLLTAMTTACGPDEDDSRSAPHDIVADLGGEVAVLDDLNASPRVVGPRPAGAENADAYRLAGPHQLASGQIVGIRDGGVVAIEPRKPGKAVLLGQASAWFPAADGKRLWAVTEEPAETACNGQDMPQSVAARYTATRYETSGRPSRTTSTAACGLRPVADTSRGLLALRTTGDTGGGGTGVRAVTDLVLLDARANTATETIATDASMVAAVGDHVIWRDDTCGKDTCTHVYDLDQRKNTAAPSCKGGDLVGTGTLDPSGRWYLSALRTHRLAILDLNDDTCHELDTLPAAGSSDLDQTFGIAWAGSHVLLLDQRSGALTSVDAPRHETDERAEPLPVVNQAQIWSASAE
ncbi:hypothetical protein [Streptomyces galbus]|uniref:Secreted protein n=1 Tax=Streptomyces galbus TaxID=33898 RepID=A0ABX1IQJ3_STRGB|nr:hypothetical protein [Streptomyces galbus]NKQ27898.1 hypothetical protein [Streptomyces galbus]